MSVRRFKVDTKVDGAKQCTVEITPTAGGTDAIFAVRPKHARQQYTILLSEVVLMAVARASKQNLAARGITVPKPRKGKTYTASTLVSLPKCPNHAALTVPCSECEKGNIR